MTKDSVWNTLSRFDVSAEVQQKGRFDYLSWAWAWAWPAAVGWCRVPFAMAAWAQVLQLWPWRWLGPWPSATPTHPHRQYPQAG